MSRGRFWFELVLGVATTFFGGLMPLVFPRGTSYIPVHPPNFLAPSACFEGFKWLSHGGVDGLLPLPQHLASLSALWGSVGIVVVLARSRDFHLRKRWIRTMALLWGGNVLFTALCFLLLGFDGFEWFVGVVQTVPLLVCLGLLCFVLRLHYARYVVDLSRCRSCGYGMAGMLSGTCPECGTFNGLR